MTMSLQQFVYLLWLAPFAFGALAFCTLTIFYWRQLREQRGAGGGIFGVFTAVCGLAFLLNLAAQAASLREWVSPALDLATGMVPALLLHLVYREEQCRLAWLRNGFYAVSLVVGGAMAGVDAGLLPAAWADTLESAPALQLGAAGMLGLLLEGLSKRRRDVAERRYRIWICVLLCLMVQTSAAVLLQLSPAVRLLPDYLLLTFFGVTLYYKERLVFFDLVLKRGVFLAFSVLVLATFFLVRPATAWAQWLLLAPLWLAGPWIYGVLARTIDRVWLRRRYTAVEAERRFVAAVQAAENEGDLRVRAAQALSEIFEAAADVRFSSDRGRRTQILRLHRFNHWISRPDDAVSARQFRTLPERRSQSAAIARAHAGRGAGECALPGTGRAPSRTGQPRGVEGAARADQSALPV